MWLRGRRQRREQQLQALDDFRVARRLMAEEVTALGEDLAELHVDTLADDLPAEARSHYQRALDHYDRAKERLHTASTAQEVLAVPALAELARYHRACVLAVRDDLPLPERREPCFFDPRHGPSMQDVEWTPPAGVARTVAVCAADARRLAGGEDPQVRLVRVGDRHVPWHQAGGMAAIIDNARNFAGDPPGSHNRQLLAQAHLNQTMNGPNGSNGPFGGGLG